MIGPLLQKLHGQLRLTAEVNTAITDAEKYYKISGTFSDGHASGFEVVNNKLKYTGPSGVCFHFSGASDLRVNKACRVTYSLYKNGELVHGAQTPHDFTVLSRTSTISITAIVELDQGDELDVYIKSDTINTIATVESLNIVLWG